MALGIGLASVANVGINLGTNIIKLAFNRRQAKVEEYKEALAMIEEDVTEDWSDPTKAAAHTAAPATVNGKSDEGGPGGGLAGKENGVGGGGGELAYSSSTKFVDNPMLSEEDEQKRDGKPGDAAGVAGPTAASGPMQPTKVKPIVKWRSWQVGFMVFKVSNVINFIALGFGKQSVIAAISSVQFVSNLLFCSFVLQERLEFKDVLGTLLIVSGVVVCIVANSSGGEGGTVYTIDDLMDLSKERAYLIYLTCLSVIALLAWMTFTGNFFICTLDMDPESIKSKSGEKYVDTKGVSPARLKSMKSSARRGGGNMEHDGSWPPPWLPLESIRPVSFATYSAVIGTQVVTLSKITMLQIRLSIEGDNQFDKMLTYVFVLAMMATGIFWDKQINVGLRKFDALVIVPVMQSFWTMLSIMNGGVFFQEFMQMSTGNLLTFGAGALIMLFGMMLLMWHDEDVFEEDLLITVDEESGATSIDLGQSKRSSFASDDGGAGAGWREQKHVQFEDGMGQTIRRVSVTMAPRPAARTVTRWGSVVSVRRSQSTVGSREGSLTLFSDSVPAQQAILAPAHSFPLEGSPNDPRPSLVRSNSAPSVGGGEDAGRVHRIQNPLSAEGGAGGTDAGGMGPVPESHSVSGLAPRVSHVVLENARIGKRTSAIMRPAGAAGGEGGARGPGGGRGPPVGRFRTLSSAAKNVMIGTMSLPQSIQEE